MAQGFAFGTGSAIARSAVDSIMGGGNKSEAVPQAAPQQYDNNSSMKSSNGPCDFDRKEFMSCLQANPNSSNQCDFFYNALQACQQNNN